MKKVYKRGERKEKIVSFWHTWHGLLCIAYSSHGQRSAHGLNSPSLHTLSFFLDGSLAWLRFDLVPCRLTLICHQEIFFCRMSLLLRTLSYGSITIRTSGNKRKGRWRSCIALIVGTRASSSQSRVQECWHIRIFLLKVGWRRTSREIEYYYYTVECFM